MRLSKLILFIILMFGIFSCKDNDSDYTEPEETARVSIKLIDEPGDYEHIFVEVIDVMIKYGDESDTEEGDNDNTDEDDLDDTWQSLGIIEPGIYDLLELTGGINLPLVENEEIEAGFIKQIRLVLGDQNSIVFSGETEERPLTTPSAQQSGLKVKVNQPIIGGFDYTFILDFEADESIVVAGNSGMIILKPVLRANLEVNSGTIQGNVLPENLIVGIEAANETVTATTMTDDNGNFVLSGLPAGLYTLTLTPDDNSGFDPVILNDVIVLNGEITNLDTVVFE